MNHSNLSSFQSRQWRMLLIYNIYRLVTIVILFAVYWFDARKRSTEYDYLYSLIAYLLFAILYLYIWKKRLFRFEQQVLWSGIIDLLVMVLMINALGFIHTGLGILLNVSIAVLSILTPGRLAIFFAAIASCMLLAISSAQYMTEVQHNPALFFATGIYGAGFFTTAITAWYLARWVRSSEKIATQKATQLAHVERLNEYIIERLQYGLIFIDREMNIKLINTAAKHFLNLPETSKPIELHKASWPLYDKFLQFRSRAGRKNISVQTNIDSMHLQVYFTSTHYRTLNGVLIILEDMHNIAKQAQDLKLASLGRFSASIAHELRNPLGAIAHAVQLLGEDGLLSAEDQHLKEMIVSNCKRMNDVIKNVLQMSRREQSQPEIIHIISFLSRFKDDFCQSHPCNIEIEKGDDKDKTLVFDRSQLEQILVIICDNALTHGKNKQGQTNIHISLLHKADKIVLSITDDGSGIDIDLRESIFEPFFTTTTTGNGMGLFIARDLCEINQARLLLMDSIKGSCFQIHFNQVDEMQL